jgi:transglutaminase-like putative cysteine protease
MEHVAQLLNQARNNLAILLTRFRENKVLRRTHHQLNPLRLIAGLVVIIASLATIPAYASDVVPDWLREQVTASVPAHDDKTNAVVLYDELVVTVAPTGKIKYLTRRALRILRPDGEGWGTVRVNFDQQTQITKLHAWSIPADGKPFEVKEKQAIETSLYGVENGELLSDTRTRVLKIPAATPGSVIGYEYEQEDYPYLLLTDWDFQENIPVRASRYTLNLPAGWSFQVNWLNHAVVEPTSVAPGQWQWSVTDLKPIRDERNMPPWQKIAGRMSLALIKPGDTGKKALTWADVGAWHSELTRGRQDANAQMRQKVAELISTKTTPLSKMNALAGFVQTDIRYVAIELGIGGYQPHAAADVFQHRYGDCKDKATLLASLLREIGIQSYYVFINTVRGAVDVNTPPNLAFNHAILAIALPEDVDDPSLLAVMRHPTLGRLLFFDPTNPFTPLGRIDGGLQANYGLLVAAQSGELLALPQLPASSSYVRRTAKLKLNAQGDLAGDLQDVRVGDSAADARYGLRLATQESDRIQPVEHLLADSLTSFNLTHAEIANLSVTDLPFEWHYSFEAPRYAKLAGDLMMVRPWVLGSQSTGLLETREPRQNPIEFDGPQVDSDNFEIALPDGYEVEELPPATNLDIGYLAYHSKTEKVGRTIRYVRSLEVKQLSVPAAKADQLKDFYRQVYGDERRMAVLKKTGN